MGLAGRSQTSTKCKEVKLKSIISFVLCIAFITAHAQTKIDSAIIKSEIWLKSQYNYLNNPGVIYDLWLAQSSGQVNLEMPSPWDIQTLSNQEKALFQTLKSWKEKKQKPSFAELELLGSSNELLRNEIFSMFCSDVAMPSNLLHELNEQSEHGGYYACYTLRELNRMKIAHCIDSNDSTLNNLENNILQGLQLLLSYPDLVGCTPTLNLNFTCFTLLETENMKYLKSDHVNKILSNQLDNGSWAIDENNMPDLFSTAYAYLFLNQMKAKKILLD